MSKIITLLLARHGNTFERFDTPTIIGKTDLPLTEFGKTQAKNLGLYFNEYHRNINKIYVGNLKRQIETAKIIQNALASNIELVMESSLNEIDFGDWEGLTPTEIQSRWPIAYKGWTEKGIWQDDVFKPTFQETIANLRTWLNTVKQSCQPGDTILGISSNGLIRLLLYFIPELWQKISHENQFELYKINTGNFCQFKLDGDILNIEKWNVNTSRFGAET